MASFEIHWRPSIKRDLRRIPHADVTRIIAAVETLRNNPLPLGNHKLAGSEQTYRIRVGDYRVVYEILASQKQIEIQRVRHRKDVYR